MTIRAPFKPHYGTNLTVTPAAASASSPINATDKSVRVTNSGATLGYFRIGTGATTASATDVIVLPSTSIIVEKGDGQDTIAYISAVGTTFSIMTGEGGQ
jgi:hypothetical protein